MSEEVKANVNMDLLFPILFGPGIGPKVYVPSDFVAPHERQAQRNHNQTLKRLAERGGLSPCELLAILEDRDYKKIGDAEAWMSIWGHYRVFVLRAPSPELTTLIEAAVVALQLIRCKLVLNQPRWITAVDALETAIIPFYGEKNGK